MKIRSKSFWLRFVLGAFFAALLLTLFQNCGEFKTADLPFSNNVSAEKSPLPLESNLPSCEIANGKGQLQPQGFCQVIVCNNNYHIDVATNSCLSNQQNCSVANGSGQQSWQNNQWSTCQLQQCDSGFHNENNSCVANVKSCTPSGGGNGSQTWVESAWGACMPSACSGGQHMENNVCVSNTKTCTIDNGTGNQTWNGTNWGSCAATSCNSGYHIENNSCVSNTRACSVANGNGTQNWMNSWSACQNVTCFQDFHVSGASCIGDHEKCTDAGKTGTRGWVNNAWGSCKVCDGGYTSFAGQCFDNWIVAKELTSYLPSCWKDGAITCPVTPIEAFIGTPANFTATSAQSTNFKVKYTRASSISLNANHVQLNGTGIAGCQKAVTGSGTSERMVTISNCTGVGNLRISISAGSATHLSGATLGAFGPSSDVMIVNSSGVPNVAYTTTVLKYPGSTGADIPYEVSYPTDYQSRANLPVLIWIHGGAWVGGSYTDNTDLAKIIASLGFIVINANYTLAPALSTYPTVVAPNSRYMVGPNDINSLTSFVKANVGILNGDPSNISIAGVSDGGHLAALQATRSDNPVNFKCLLNLAGPTDLKYASININYPVSAWIINSVFGADKTFLNSMSAVTLVGSLKAQKVALMHQLRDNLVPIEHALQFSQSLKSSAGSVQLFHIYGDEANSVIYRPEPAQTTHLFSDTTELNIAMKTFFHTHCR